MTIRQPIETWTRPQLEDQYHAVYEQLQEAKKKIQELDKELIKYNTRIRRTLLEKKSKDEEMVEKAKYDEVVRDNEILAMKLKTAKHQLLVYTTPSARPVTALSIITGRSTYRPISTVRRQPNTGAYATVTDRGTIEYEPTDPVQQHTIGTRDPTVRITEAVVSEKATIIRLNRTLKEKNQQIADLQFQLNRLSTQNQQLLSSKLEHRPKYSKDETKFDSDNESSNQENGNTERELENGSGDGIGKTMTGQERNSDRHRTEARLEMMQKELLILRNECEVLKDANERLVRESLSRDFDAGATEQIELKKEIARLEENVREAETRENEANRRRKEMAEQMKRIESRKTTEQTKIVESTTTRHEQNLEALRQAEIEEREMEIEERREKQKRKKNGWKGEGRGNGDVLEKLYRDVTGLLESYDRNAGDSIDEFDGEQANSVAKWRQMYAELYDELEKIAIMQEERVRALALFEKKMEEMSDQINEKSKKIYQLEEEIRTIAYSGQVALPVKIDQVPSSPPASNDISLHLSNISFSSSVSALNSFFVTLEFFDFELQTTPVMQWRSQAIDFTTVYNVLLSNLFVYYLESNGISVEIYSPKGTKCELVAAGVISLKRLLKAPKGKSKQMQIGGELRMISPSSAAVVAVISYDVTLAKDLTDSIASYQRLESARNFLPLENWQTGQAFEELTIIVNKCSGLETLGKGSVETCIAYELLSFSPFMTNYVTTDKTAVFDSTKNWAIPIAENMHKFIQDTEIVFFLAQNTAENRDTEPVLAMLSLPLAPLAQNRKIKGVFPMLDAEGNQTQLQLELSIFWKYGKPISKHFAHQFVEEKEKPTRISKDGPAKSDKSKLERVDKTESRETQERIEESKPISVEDHIKSLEPHGMSLPSLESSHSEETIEKEDTAESLTAGRSDSQTVQPTSEEKIEKTIEEGPIIGEVEEVTEIVRERTEGKADESEQTQDQRAEMIEEVDLPEANAMLSRQSSTSGESDATYTMEKRDEGTEEKSSSNGLPAQDAEAEADKMKDLAKDEIRQMLKNLPPIAKPRLSKPPSEFQQSFPPSTLDFLERLDKKHQLKEQDEEGTGEEEGSDGMDNRERKIFFTDPLHQSIPPSEASSVASPTSRPEREKQPIQLPEKGGKSVIKLRSEADNASSKEEGHENEEGSVVSVFIAKFAITDFSRLLTRNYDGVKVYIDWTFLDFPVEESRISETFELPRVPNVWIPIEFRKEYTLSRRRVALLEQWIELGNRLDFTLIAQTEDDRHEEELGVAQLELHRIPADYATTIPFLDVNGDQLAEVEVVLHYSASLFQ